MKILATTSGSQVHFTEIYKDPCLSYRVHSLCDAFRRELAPVLRETEYIRRNSKYNEVNPLTCNYL